MNEVGAGAYTATISNNIILEGDRHQRGPIPHILSLGFATNSPPRLDHLVVMRRNDLTPATATPIMDPYVRHITVLAAGAFLGGVLLVAVLGLALYWRQKRRWQRELETDVVVQADLDCPKAISITSDHALLLANEEAMCEDLTTVLTPPNGGGGEQQIVRSDDAGSHTWLLQRSMSWPGDGAVTAPSLALPSSRLQQQTRGSTYLPSEMAVSSAFPEVDSCRDARSDSWPSMSTHGGAIPKVWSVLPAATYASPSVMDPVLYGDCTSTRHELLEEPDHCSTVLGWDRPNFTVNDTCDLMYHTELTTGLEPRSDISYNTSSDTGSSATWLDISDITSSSTHRSVTRGTSSGYSPLDVSLTCFASDERGSGSDTSSYSTVQWTTDMSGSMTSESADSGVTGIKMEATSRKDEVLNTSDQPNTGVVWDASGILEK